MAKLNHLGVNKDKYKALQLERRKFKGTNIKWGRTGQAAVRQKKADHKSNMSHQHDIFAKK